MTNHDSALGQTGPTFSAAPLDIADIWGIAKRGWAYMVLGTALGLVGAILVLAVTPPTYKANARLVMERSASNYLRSNRIIDGPVLADDTWSQPHIIMSERVVRPVVEKLNLANDPVVDGRTSDAKRAEPPDSTLDKIKRFAQFARSILSEIKQLSKLQSPEPSRLEPEEIAVQNILNRLYVWWEVHSSIISIDFYSTDPVIAATIANAVAESYIESTLQSKRKAAALAFQAMADRLADLRTKAANAERKLIDFKLANIPSAARPGARTTNDLNNLSSQIANARMAMLDARARLDAQQREGETSRYIPDNDLIRRLRQQYLEAETRALSMAQRVGQGHAATIELRKRMQELTAAIEAERRRVEQSYGAEYLMTKAVFDALNASLQNALSEQAENSKTAAQIRELESSAETLRNLYNSLLQRVSEQNRLDSSVMVMADVAMLSRATIPTQTESSKKRLLVLASGSFLGLLLGVVIAFLLRYPVGVFRTADQVKTSLGLLCLVFPKLKKKRSTDLTKYGLDFPRSRFSETLRILWTMVRAAQVNNNAKVICIVSSVANEGKTTIATNLASLISRSTGMKTLLIDADHYKRTLTLATFPEAKQGIREALDEPRKLADFVIKLERSGVDLLPCSLCKDASEPLASSAMEELIKVARASYDFVLVEAPPIALVADSRLLAPFCDCFIFVIEWGKTSQRLVFETFGEIKNFWERVLCVVLNKAEPKALRSIERYRGESYNDYFVEGQDNSLGQS